MYVLSVNKGIKISVLNHHSSLLRHSCPLGGEGRSLPSQSFFLTSVQSVDSTVPPLVWKLFIIALLFSSSPCANICLKKDMLVSSPYSSPCLRMSPSISLSILSQFFFTFELDGQRISCLGAPSGMPMPSLLKNDQFSLCLAFSITISMLSSRWCAFDLAGMMPLKRIRSRWQISWLFLMGKSIVTLSSSNLIFRPSFFSTTCGISMPTFAGV